MKTEETVLAAFDWLMRRHRGDLLVAEQVNIGILPKTGHGDDLWLRTEHVHVVAEVTVAGSEREESAPLGTRRQAIIEKLNKLRDRAGVTHRYLFLAETFVAWARSRSDRGDVEIVAILETAPGVVEARSLTALAQDHTSPG